MWTARLDSIGLRLTPTRLVVAAVLIATMAAFGLGRAPVLAASSSGQVAIVGSATSQNGGTLPTTPAAFSGFNFTVIPIANVTTSTLLSYDTVVLNVASGGSTGLQCNVNGKLSVGQKAAIVNWVALGHKLIIYDSECASQDYSWLPYPFDTNNPGQRGAQGTVTVVEDNTLSSSDPSSAQYIATTTLAHSTDAIGDMNVLTTFDPNWCLDMQGTNVTPATGPVHTYAHYGSGLIVYNGMDIDYLYSSTMPSTTTGAGNLAKIWLQELQQAFNPDNLPCGTTVVGIDITPLSAQNSTGGTHTITATVHDVNTLAPSPNVLVTFAIDAGPNAGEVSDPNTGECVPNNCMTNSAGQVSWTYSDSNGPGTDEITASFTNSAQETITSQTATKEWVAASDTTPPTCQLDTSGWPPTLRVTIWDTGSGLAKIEGIKVEGLTLDTPLPTTFSPATTNPVVITATKAADHGALKLRVTDAAGNLTECDPSFNAPTVIRSPGKPTVERFDDFAIPNGVLIVRNGTPGVSNVEIAINGQDYKLPALKNGEIVRLYISKSVGHVNNNVIEVTAKGNPGTVTVYGEPES